MSKPLPYTRLFDIPYHQLANFPKEDCLCEKINGAWKKYSSQEVIDKINEVSSALLRTGLSRNDKVAIISNNRPTWNFLDFGMMQLGIVNVPVYPTISEEEYRYIFNDAQVKMVFVSSAELFEKVKRVQAQVPCIQEVFTFEPVEGASHLDEFLARAHTTEDLPRINSIKNAIHENEMACIIYTSGTTGFPKGVMLSHSNVIENIKGSMPYVPVDHQHKALSFLPLNHVFEKLIIYLYISCGVSVYYAESVETIGDNLKELRPHIFTAVPRLLEKVFEKIMSKGMELKGIKRVLFFWSIRLGEKYDTQKNGSFFYRLQLSIANKLVFKKWRDALGGNIICIVSGAAALQVRLARIFWAGKIPVLEGYGLTETSPVVSVNHVKKEETLFGSIGRPIDNVKVKLGPDNELLVQGQNIMMGYYNQPKLTDEVIDKEGWFHTGDIGEILPGGFLKITDRKKELFKTSGGKYVAPQIIENKLKEHHLVEQVMLTGNNLKFVAALIVPAMENLKKWCIKNNIPWTQPNEMLKNEKVLGGYRRIIDEMNKTLGHVEQVKKFILVPDEWTTQNGMLTPTLKLKRVKLLEHYQPEINKMYGSND